MALSDRVDKEMPRQFYKLAQVCMHEMLCGTNWTQSNPVTLLETCYGRLGFSIQELSGLCTQCTMPLIPSLNVEPYLQLGGVEKLIKPAQLPT